MKRILIFFLTLCLLLNLPYLPAIASDGESTEENMEELAPQEQTEEAQQEPQESQDNLEDTQENTEEKDVDTVSQSETPDETEPAEEPAVEEAQNTEPAAGAADATQVDDSLGITAPSAVLIEASTGTVILEKNSHEKLPPASVTKIMTLLLIFDAISQGKIKLEDTVTTSTYAASMGGSQVFLEEGESQSVDTMIKCISVASANDASVAYKYSRHFQIQQVDSLSRKFSLFI